jgi:hypothetical protein
VALRLAAQHWHRRHDLSRSEAAAPARRCGRPRAPDALKRPAVLRRGVRLGRRLAMAPLRHKLSHGDRHHDWSLGEDRLTRIMSGTVHTGDQHIPNSRIPKIDEGIGLIGVIPRRTVHTISDDSNSEESASSK